MRLAVDMLQVQQHGVCALHQPQELAVERFAARKRLGCRVETRVDATPVRLLEERDKPVDLQQRLTAADRDATLVAPIGTIAFSLVEQLRHRGSFLLCSGHAPRVGIVAIAAAHVAAFEKDDETDAGTVDRAKRLGGVNV